MFSVFHQWCFALAIWGLVVWVIPHAVLNQVWLALGAIALLWFCRIGIWVLSEKLGDKYGD